MVLLTESLNAFVTTRPPSSKNRGQTMKINPENGHLVKVRPFTALPYQQNNKSRNLHKSDLVIDYNYGYNSTKDEIIENLFKNSSVASDFKVASEEESTGRVGSAVRRRNYLDFISKQILTKNILDFAGTKMPSTHKEASFYSTTRPMSFVNIKNTRLVQSAVASQRRKTTRHHHHSTTVDLTENISDSDIENLIDTQSIASFQQPRQTQQIIDQTELKIELVEQSRIRFLSELTEPSIPTFDKAQEEEYTQNNYNNDDDNDDSSFKSSTETLASGGAITHIVRKSPASSRRTPQTSNMYYAIWSRPAKPAVTKFRKTVHLIVLLLQAVSRIRTRISTAQSCDISPKIIRDGLVFDINSFKRPKEIGLDDEAKRIMKLPSYERSEELVRITVAHLVQAIPEYNDFPLNIQKAIVKVCHFEIYEAGRVIIRQGHKADNFYLIVSGITAVSKSDRNPKTGEPISRTVAYLSKGKTFGELAIMHQSPRNATVTCHTDVCVLTIDRDDFIDIFMHVEEGKEPEHISFLREIEFFNDWPIHKLPYDNPRVCLLTYFRKGLVMCKDSNKNDWIYIVKNGACKVLKALEPPVKPAVQVRQSFNLVETPRKENIFSSKPKQYPVFEEQIAKPSPRKSITSLGHNVLVNMKKTEKKDKKILQYEKKLISSKLKFNDEEAKLHRDFDTIGDKGKKLYIEVQQLLSKDIFGLVHLVFGSIEESTSVTLVSEGAECILINKAFFMKYLNDDLRKKLRETVRPYPSEFDLQNKLQVNNDWKAYRNQTIKDFYLYKRKLQESLFV